MATVDLKAEFDLKLAGSIMAGVSVKLQNVEAVIDIVDNDRSKRPVFNPKVKPVASVSGAMAAKFDLSVEIGLAPGLEVAKKAASASVSLISEPGVTVLARGAAMASLVNGANIAVEGCQGIKLDYEIYHKFYAQAQASLIFKQYAKKQWPLVDDYRDKIGGTCIGRQTKRQIDNGTALDGEDTDEDGSYFYPEWDLPYLVLEPPKDGDEPYVSMDIPDTP